MDNPKKKYIVVLFIIPIIIANMHAAIWPIYFVMYLPYIAEYLLSRMSLEKNMKKLIIIMLCAVLTEFMTSIGDTPFTYMIKQFEIW